MSGPALGGSLPKDEGVLAIAARGAGRWGSSVRCRRLSVAYR
jgi:hypothetical protein